MPHPPAAPREAPGGRGQGAGGRGQGPDGGPPPRAGGRHATTTRTAAAGADAERVVGDEAILSLISDEREDGSSLDGGSRVGQGPGSAALQALGKVLDTQFAANGEGVRRLRVELSDVRHVVSSETSRLEGGLQRLQELQLDHARASYVEATRRESDTSKMEEQLRTVTERLKEVDEQCYFLKDTLYSILTSRGSSGIQVPPLPGKKPLKPLKGTPSATAPWNTAIMPSGM